MARTMEMNHTGIYRTVVRTTYVEDSKKMTWKYDDRYNRVNVPTHKAGDVVTEIFGPYINKAQNQNYSMGYSEGYWVELDEPMYQRSDFSYLSDEGWESSGYKDRKKREYHNVVKYDVRKEQLTPVFALQPNGSLTMELDWVKYGN